MEEVNTKIEYLKAMTDVADKAFNQSFNEDGDNAVKIIRELVRQINSDLNIKPEKE